jgi:hypothetical protein
LKQLLRTKGKELEENPLRREMSKDQLLDFILDLLEMEDTSLKLHVSIVSLSMR